jgi:hypothetical protein
LSKPLKKKDLKPIERDTPELQRWKKYGKFTRLPILKQRHRKKVHPRGFDVEAGQYIPVTRHLGLTTER